MPAGAWVIDVFRTEQGEALVQVFMAALIGRDRDEAFALPKKLKRMRGYRKAVLRQEARKGKRS